ncbi:MAG: hypothetical protein PHN92_04595 [Geobacter sp.]|nr:hypothetical protein [Geobacter sp.]
MAAVAFHTYCQAETVSTISWSVWVAATNKTGSQQTNPVFLRLFTKKRADRLQTVKLVLSSFSKL